MDRLSAIEAFIRVAETGSFSAAAVKLRSSKSAVSRLIGALETELGARLFHRTTRSLTLTEVGRGYLERTTRIVADLDEANRAVTRLQAAPRGLLRVAAPMSFGFLHLAGALPDFLALYPEVSVDVAMSDRFVDLVEEGFDVAVRIGEMQDTSLIARKLAPVRIAICASPDYLAAHGVPQKPADLAHHECIANSNLASSREWRFVDERGKKTSVSVRGRMNINNGDALRVAALKGLGIIALPTFIVGSDIHSGALVSLLEKYVPQNATINAVYPHARHLSPKVRAFVDFLAQRFGPHPYWDACFNVNA